MGKEGRSRKLYVNAGVSIVLTFLLAYILRAKIHTWSWLYIGIAIFLFIIFNEISQDKKQRNSKVTFFMGWIFAVMYLLGVVLEDSALTVSNLIVTMILGNIGGGLFVFIEQKLSKYKKQSEKINIEYKENDHKYFWMCVIIILSGYLIVFLAYFPGIFGYDVEGQLGQHIKGYTTHHPLAHTILLEKFYNLVVDNRNFGMALYTICQMSFLALCNAFLILFLKRIGVGLKWRNLWIVMATVHPVFSVLSISITKDIYFTGFFILLCTLYAYFEMDKNIFYKKWYKCLLLLSIFGVGLFRNNGLYILLFVMLFIMYNYINHKKNGHLKKIFIYTVSGIIGVFLVNSFLVYKLNAKNGSINEMLSVPYQQIASAYYYNSNKMSQNDIDKVKEIIPDIADYNMSVSDPIKHSATVPQDNIREFLEIYFKLFTEYAVEYLEGALRVTQGYWYLDDITCAKIYGEGLENRQGYLLTDTKEGYGVTHISYFRYLEKIFEYLFSLNAYRKFPVIATVFSLSLYFWINMISIVYGIKRNGIKIPQVMVLSLIATLFMGPCVLPRYAFSYIAVLPIMISFNRKI